MASSKEQQELLAPFYTDRHVDFLEPAVMGSIRGPCRHERHLIKREELGLYLTNPPQTYGLLEYSC